MSNFSETVKQDTPRLVVQFGYAPDGSESFQWGIVGDIPILSLIGNINRLQMQLLATEWIPEFDLPGQPPALVMAWDAERKLMSSYLHRDIPIDPMCGMLETIKAALVMSRLGQKAVSHRSAILGPDGRPNNR